MNGYMNKKGQIGKAITAPFVLIGILVIMALFLLAVGYISKPNIDTSIVENKIIDIPLFDKITVEENGIKKEMLIIEGLDKYRQTIEHTPLEKYTKPSAYSADFTIALKSYFSDLPIVKSGTTKNYCLTMAYEEESVSYFVFVRGDGKTLPGAGSEKIRGSIINNQYQGYEVKTLPFMTLNKDGKEIKIFYYLGGCGR